MSTLDNPIMENDQAGSPWPIAFRYGGIIALLMITITLIQYLTGMTDPSKAQSPLTMIIGLISFTVWIGGVVMAVRTYRSQIGGYMTFGEGFKAAFFTFLVIAVISAVWSFFYYNFLATDFFEKLLDFMQSTMEESGADEDAIDMIMGIYRKIYNPTGFTMMSLFGGGIFGAIVSLIIGAALQKRRPES